MKLTLEELKQAEITAMELQANPYCDHLMFMSLVHKLEGIREQIKQKENG
tara:strand:+ start:224199 stop:224348 length:150 start_codon:yes stop_codon:yes gene_type:complete